MVIIKSFAQPKNKNSTKYYFHSQNSIALFFFQSLDYSYYHIIAQGQNFENTILSNKWANFSF